MDVHTGQAGLQELREAVDRLGAPVSRKHWCAFVGEWLAHTGAPLWNGDVLQDMPLVAGIERTLLREADKISLMVLPEGSFVLLAQDISYTGFERLNRFLTKVFEETRLAEHRMYQWQAYDLEMEWNEFELSFRRIMAHYARELSFQEKMDALEDLLRHTIHKHDTRATRGRPIKVLFAEQGLATGRLLVPLLDHTKVALDFAGSGEEAIKAYAATPPHMLFLDTELPDISGLAVLDRVTRHDPLSHVMMLINSPEAKQTRTPAQRQVKGYLLRPFTPQQVVECVETYRRLNGWG